MARPAAAVLGVVQHDVGGRLARRALSTTCSAAGILRQRRQLPGALRAVVEQRRQRVGQLRRPCSSPDETRETPSRPAPGWAAPTDGAVISRRSTGAHHGIHLVGHHHRRAGQRQLQRHGAGSGQRRPRQLEGAELVLLALDQMRPLRPRRQMLLDQRAHRSHHRHDDLELAAPLAAGGPASRRTAASGASPRRCGCPAAPPAAACRAASARRSASGAGSSAAIQGRRSISGWPT